MAQPRCLHIYVDMAIKHVKTKVQNAYYINDLELHYKDFISRGIKHFQFCHKGSVEI